MKKEYLLAPQTFSAFISTNYSQNMWTYELVGDRYKYVLTRAL